MNGSDSALNFNSIRFGLLISCLLFIFSYGLQLFFPLSVHAPEWPLNGIILLGFISIIVSFCVLRHRIKIIEWFFTPSAWLGALLVFILIILLTSVSHPAKNTTDHSFFQHRQNWPWIINTVYLLFTLGLSVARMITEFRDVRKGIFLAHLGLWIVIMAAFFGAGDYKHLTINLYEDEVAETAVDRDGKKVRSPFRIKLNRFQLTEYNPELAIVDEAQGKIFRREGFRADSGVTGYILDWEIQVVQYLPCAWKLGSLFYPLNETGCAPAAELIVRNTKTQLTTDGWVSCGSHQMPQVRLQLDNMHQVAMAVPDPKEYLSWISVLDATKTLSGVIGINRPLSFKGWKIYQTGYDIRKGRWSDLSVVALIRDPWNVIVNTGLIVLFAGMFGIFIQTIHSFTKP